MDDIGGERGRKGDALLTPPRGPGLPSSSSPSPSGSRLLPSPPSAAAAAAVLALPASRDPTASPDAGFLAAPRLAGAMDGGGEALLVRRRKGKKKRPAAAAPAERDSGARDRFRSLWRDYNDLLEETQTKKRRLASADRRKLAILAEVKFLRRKYGSFVKGNSQKTHYKLKKQARYIPSPLGRASAFANHDGAGTEGTSSSKDPSLELNQNSVMNDEGNDCQEHRGHLEPDKFGQVGVDEEMIAADAKLSVCRNTGSSPASDDKRAIPWQDRLALKA